MQHSKSYVKKCDDVIWEKSDRARPRKDTAMTLCACGNLTLLCGHLLLTHTCRSPTLTVSTLTWTSLLGLIYWNDILYQSVYVHTKDS